jgi:excisionase family DNA binding protein
MTRRYISIAEAAEYLGISARTVRRLIAEGQLKAYRIGKYPGRLIRIDLDEIDEQLMNPIGPYWDDDSARPSKPAAKPPPPDRSAAVKRAAPLHKVYYRFCVCRHAIRDHAEEDGPCSAPTWVNLPGQLSRDTGPCKCKKFDEDVKRRRRKPKKYQG